MAFQKLNRGLWRLKDRIQGSGKLSDLARRYVTPKLPRSLLLGPPDDAEAERWSNAVFTTGPKHKFFKEGGPRGCPDGFAINLPSQRLLVSRGFTMLPLKFCHSDITGFESSPITSRPSRSQNEEPINNESTKCHMHDRVETTKSCDSALACPFQVAFRMPKQSRRFRSPRVGQVAEAFQSDQELLPGW